jgi:hypothetical protein
MELSVTIELHEEEMRKFDEFIEDGCFDKTKYLKKMLLVGVAGGGRPQALADTGYLQNGALSRSKDGSNGDPAGRMSGLEKKRGQP